MSSEASTPASDQPSGQRPRVSVVIPALNEADSLEQVTGHVLDQLEAAGCDGELVLVDDGSSDRTWPVIVGLADNDDRVRGLSLSRNFGKDSAIMAGLQEASGEAVVVMDADCQHPPELLPRMIEQWRAGADLVEAIKRSRPDQSLPTRLGARLFNRLFSRLTGVDLANATDFRLLSRPALEAMAQLSERALFFRGTSAWIGYKRARIEFDPKPRAQGQSRFTGWSLARFAVRSLTAFTSLPLHLVTLAGLAFGAFSLLVGLHTLYRWASGTAVEGFTTVILLLLIQGSVIMLALGIIGEYLARIHEEVKGRPRYLVRARAGKRVGAPGP